MPEDLRADYDHLGAREGKRPVHDVQEHESRAAARKLYNADGEEELTVAEVKAGSRWDERDGI
jgi:hypothetical protein